MHVSFGVYDLTWRLPIGPTMDAHILQLQPNLKISYTHLSSLALNLTLEPFKTP